MKNSAHKFRIYPTNEQIDFFNTSIKYSKFIYNYFLNEQQLIDNMLKMCGLSTKERKDFKAEMARLDKGKKTPEHSLYFNAYEASKELTLMCNTTHTHLKKIDSTARGYVLSNLETAFSNIYKMGAGFPKFKNRRSSNNFSGQILYKKDKESPINFKISKSSEKSNYCLINIPKIKGLKCVIHKDEFKHYWDKKDDMKLNSYTVSKTANDEWYISFQVLNSKWVEPKEQPILEENIIGIDMGVIRPITTSDITDYDNPAFSTPFDDLKIMEKEVKRLNKIISKKMERNKDWRNSNKYLRIRNKISNIQNKIKNKREYYQHQITSELVKKDNINLFVIENLQVKNMTKRAKVRNIKQKSGLNKAILNVGFFGLSYKLEYKAKEEGKKVERINPRNTSITCSCCGNINKKNRLSQSLFICVTCGHTENADLNASKNIKNVFLKTLDIK